MARSLVSFATEQLRARLGVIKGIIGPDEKEQSDPDEIKEARQLTNDVLRLLDEAHQRQLKTEEATAISAKTTASETLIIHQLPIAHLLSGLRDSCMQILALTDRITGEYAAKERSFATETLKELSSRNALNDEEIRRLYLQARQRLDSLLADRLMLMQAAHHFMSSLWLRTATAILICSIPVIIFVYARYWQPTSHSQKLTHSASPPLASPSAESADIYAPKRAAEVKELLEALTKLPAAAEKPKLNSKDIREFLDTPIIREGRVGAVTGYINNLANEPSPPPGAAELAKLLKSLQNASDVEWTSALRDAQHLFVDLDAALDARKQQAEQASQLTTPPPEENDENLRRSPQEENDENASPLARLATLFSVVIMGIAGAFVSNYSRVCALLKEAMPLGISSADRSIRIRFSPFVGGLLAIILSEVFGGHLVQGDLFPMTEHMHRWTDLIWSGQAYSKLLLWGFVAGLSENYVLRTLGSLAMRVGFGGKSQESKQPAE
jgi:hypothetical protein